MEIFFGCGELKAGKRSGADALLDPLRRFAANVGCEQELHDAIIRFVDALCEQTLRLDYAYAESKRTSGFVDFIDLERLFLQVLEAESERPRLQSDIDLALVDEFQDTSPLQLAIFSRLREIATCSHWVGDEKQAIYGFRGSDPELVRRMRLGAAAMSPRVRQLKKNYRSAAGLVALCGELFAETLGPEARQLAIRSDAGQVERWLIESKNVATDLLRLAGGIASLIDGGARAGEIAILARSNERLKGIAAALQQQGIASRLEQPGLTRTREGALLLAGLRVVADRFDSLAAATLCHLLSDPEDATPGWLAERLEEIGRRELAALGDSRDEAEMPQVEEERTLPPWDGHPLMIRLGQIDPRWLSPAEVTAEVVEALHLGQHTRRWGEPAQRASHIDTFLQLAAKYEDMTSDAGAPATLAGFIHHIGELAETEKDVRQPPSDADAVTLLTYHGAKGLEFPTVVLFDLGHDRQAEPWGISVSGGGAADDPTRGRSLRYWPWPFGCNPWTGSLLAGGGVEVTARQSEEGQGASRAAREESMRLLYVGFTRARDRLVLAHREKESAWLNRLPAIDRCLPPDQVSTDDRSDSGNRMKWDYRVRRLSNGRRITVRSPLAPSGRGQGEGVKKPSVIDRPLLTEETSKAVGCDSSADWFDSGMPLRRSVSRDAAWHAPSRQEASSGHQTARVEPTGATPFFPAAQDREEFRRVGESVHAYLAALPSLRDCDDAVRLRCAARCVNRQQAAGWLSPQWLVDAGERFWEWSHRRWPGGKWMCEVPFAAERSAGGNWRGIADLLVGLDGGAVVLVDHKSTPLRIEDCESEAARHSGQIAASREAVSNAGMRVVGAYVHYPLAGRIVEID